MTSTSRSRSQIRSGDSWDAFIRFYVGAETPYFGPTGLPGQAGGAQAGQPGLARSPLFTHTGDGDTIRPGHVANDYNPPVPPQAGPALRPDGDDVTPDPGL